MNNYKGSCHCGNVKFSFEHQEIKTGLRCTVHCVFEEAQS